MRNSKELLKYKLKDFKSNYFELTDIEITFDDEKDVAKVECGFSNYGIRYYGISDKEAREDKKLLLDILKRHFKNVESDLYDISFEVPDYEEYVEKIRKEIVCLYSEKWAIQVIKTKNSGYFGDNIDIDYIEELEVETTIFDSKEEAIIEYHLLKNSYKSLDYVDVKLIKVIEE